MTDPELREFVEGGLDPELAEFVESLDAGTPSFSEVVGASDDRSAGGGGDA